MCVCARSLAHLVYLQERKKHFNKCSFFFLLLNTIIVPYYHSCVFVTDIYSTHNRDDAPQNDNALFLHPKNFLVLITNVFCTVNLTKRNNNAKC